MKLRAPSSRRRPSRYDDDGDFGGDGGQQVSGASNTLRRGSGRPQRTVRTLARPLGKNDFDDPYSYSGFTTGPRPMAHNHRFNPELARHCAFPSLPMDHEGPGPSEIWKAQNQVGNDTVAEPRVEHPRYNFDVFILDAMEDSNYPEHLLDDSQLGSEETTRHKQDGNIQPEASSVNQPDRPFATTGPFWNRPPPMNPSGRPLAPFEVLRQAFWKSRRQHENVMAETATAVPQLAPNHGVTGCAKLKWVNWPELSPGIRYLIIWIMTSSGMSFTRATADLCLTSKEMIEMIDLMAVENANWAAYKKAIENPSASAMPLEPVVIRPASLLDGYSKAEIQAGKDYLQVIGLYDLVETLDGYEGVQMGAIDEPTIPLSHFDSDGYRGLLPHFNVSCLDDLHAIRKEEKRRQPFEFMSQADFLARIDPPPGTINPRRVHGNGQWTADPMDEAMEALMRCNLSPRWPLPPSFDGLINPVLKLATGGEFMSLCEDPDTFTPNPRLNTDMEPWSATGSGTGWASTLVENGDYYHQTDGARSPRPVSGGVFVGSNRKPAAKNFWGFNLRKAFTDYPMCPEDVEVAQSSRKGKEIVRHSNGGSFDLLPRRDGGPVPGPSRQPMFSPAFSPIAGPSTTSSNRVGFSPIPDLSTSNQWSSNMGRVGFSPVPAPVTNSQSSNNRVGFSPFPALAANPQPLRSHPVLPLHLQPQHSQAGPSRSRDSSMSPDVSSESQQDQPAASVEPSQGSSSASTNPAKRKHVKLPGNNPDGSPRIKRPYVKSGRYSKAAKAAREVAREAAREAALRNPRPRAQGRSTPRPRSTTPRQRTRTPARISAVGPSEPMIVEEEEEEVQDTIVAMGMESLGTGPDPGNGDGNDMDSVMDNGNGSGADDSNDPSGEQGQGISTQSGPSGGKGKSIDSTIGNDTDDAPSSADEKGEDISTRVKPSGGKGKSIDPTIDNDADDAPSGTDEEGNAINTRAGPSSGKGKSVKFATDNGTDDASSGPGEKGKSVTTHSGPANNTRSGRRAKSLSTSSGTTSNDTTDDEASSATGGKEKRLAIRTGPSANTRSGWRAKSLSATSVGTATTDDEASSGTGGAGPSANTRSGWRAKSVNATSNDTAITDDEASSGTGGKKGGIRAKSLSNPNGPSANTRSGAKAKILNAGPSSNTRSGAMLKRLSSGSGVADGDAGSSTGGKGKGKGGRSWKAKEVHPYGR